MSPPFQTRVVWIELRNGWKCRLLDFYDQVIFEGKDKTKSSFKDRIRQSRDEYLKKQQHAKPTRHI